METTEQKIDTLGHLINQIDLKFDNLNLKKCKYGWMLFDGPYIGKCFELYGEYSESEVSIFKFYLKKGSISIDVGANIGDLTVPMSLLVGNEGRVFAYESNPEIFNVLAANLALNNIKNVKPINAFVADRDDVSTASAQWGEYAYIGETWKPQFTSLDALDIPRLDFIKIDVDGFELDVLKSGVGLIKKYRPVLYLENDIKEKSRDLMEFIFGLDYRIYFHIAPIFQANNYFANPNNNWAPNNICSLMMLALPKGISPPNNELIEMLEPDVWFDKYLS